LKTLRATIATLLVACLLLTGGAATAVAAQPPSSGDTITLNFQDADIQALISTVSQITGKNFVVDPRVKGTVTLVSGEKLNVEQVYDIFLSVLDVHNFAAVEADNGLIKILPRSLVKQASTPTSFVTPKPTGDSHLTQVYHLRHGAVQELVPVLRPLLPPTSHFAAHTASNTLIFTDTAANVQRILKIVRRLDQPRPEGDIHVVYLKHAKAQDMAKLLDGIINSKQKGGDAKTPGAVYSVQAEETTNALVIQAPEDQFVFLKGVIDKLDIRRAQVFIEVLIAEVTADKAADLGVRWFVGDDRITNGQTTAGTEFSDVSGGLRLGYLKSFVEDLAGNVVPELEVVISALRSDANTNILSTPNLLTLDNETAEIIVGQEVPFVTGQYTSTGTATATDQTTGTAVVNPFQTIERKDVGLKLKIKPQINEDKSLRLELEQEVSSVSPTVVEGASDLITNTRSIKATVLVDDGKIIVLGGLIKDDLKDTIEWVPVLGKIPLFGALFRKKSKTAVKTNLMVFLRPKIVRTDHDLAGHTLDKYGYIRELEKDSHQDTRHLMREARPPVLPELDQKGEIVKPEPKTREPVKHENISWDDVYN
jgi:general secretion pathway protein D